VHINLTTTQQELKDELSAYFGALMTDERRESIKGGEAGGEGFRSLVRQIGADGWLGVGWPKEYGGHGRTPLEQYIFFDEANRAGVPLPLVTLNTVGPTLMAFGTDEQKDYFLPKILAGELHFSIGYSEPGAGTDLASLRTRAVRDGDEYVINGQKIWTTGGHDSDWIWLACRTDFEAPKHKGLSIILVPTTSPASGSKAPEAPRKAPERSAAQHASRPPLLLCGCLIGGPRPLLMRAIQIRLPLRQ